MESRMTTAESRAAASRRGARRRALREQLRRDVLLRIVTAGGPDLATVDESERILRLAKWVTFDALPEYVIDAIEAQADR
jgi:hypothetical protein